MNMNEVRSNQDSEEKDLTLYFSDFWRGFVKFWWIVILLALLGGFFMFYRSYIQFMPLYQTTATFTVYTENNTLAGDGGMSAYSFYYNRTTADQLAIVFPYVMQSKILQERVCKDLGLPVMPATVYATCVPGTNMLKIITTGTDPQVVYDVLLSVTDNYSYVSEYIIGPTKLIPITSPEVPEQPYNALDWQRDTLKGILLGLAAGAAWIVLYAILRQTIRTKEDIREELNQTCIGVLPQITFKRYRKAINTDILLNNPMIGTDFLESIRLLRSAVQNGLKENEKVILVSSTAPGEGKTVTVLNLASILAQNKGKILVIDGDLRKSGILSLLPDENPTNVSDNQLYSIDHDNMLNIDILKFHSSDKHLWNIMRSGKANEIITSLRPQYDLILIDTPPCGIISDAVIFASAADTALYVIRQDTVLSSRIREGISTLLSAEIRIMGCVLNGTLGGFGGYGSHYGYGGYSHYYRYGYSNKHKSGSSETSSGKKS